MTCMDVFGLVLLSAGVLLFAVSLFGVYRAGNTLNSLHAAAVGETMALLLVLLGLMLLRPAGLVVGKLCCILVFAWLTSPVATHMIAWTQFSGEMRSFPERKGRKEDMT